MSPRVSPWRWVLVVLAALLAIPVLLGTAGAAYQAVRTVVDARAYPPPGRLVRVDDHDMHLYCTGERRTGLPVVILEASHPTTSSSWAWVQPRVAEATRVCSYDRAGAGWSDPAPGPRTMGRAAEELHALLAAAEEPGPYVLVGHSWGGGISMLGASLDPADKRLAVQVEDHPLDCATFQGTIPEGHYAAGEVLLWDTGWWEPDTQWSRTFKEQAARGKLPDVEAKLAAGELKFILHGHKLRGSFVLVQMKNRGPKNWLLLKHKDDHARRGYNVTAEEPDSVAG